MLPIYFQPYPDELLSSWLYRLSTANCMEIRTFHERILGRSHSLSGRTLLPFDVKYGLWNLQKHLLYPINLKELYLGTSTFQFESLFMNVQSQTKAINAMFRPADVFVTPSDALYKEIKVCKDCIVEDEQKFGEPYWHCSHQLSGVVTCHKHGSLLMRHEGNMPDAYKFNLEEYAICQHEASIESEQAYTQYAEALFAGKLNANISQVRELVFKKLGDNNLDELKQNWAFQDLLPDDDETMRHKFRFKAFLGAKGWIALLMMLIPNINECCELLTSEDEIILERKCSECQNNYYTTSLAEKIGYGCFQCDSKMSVEQRYTKHIEMASDGLYIPIGKYVSMGHKSPVKHLICDRTFDVSMRGFLYEGKRCVCERQITIEKAKKEVESHEGFHMLTFDEKGKHSITVHHDDCNEDFVCDYFQFVKHPKCRNCQIAETEPFERKLRRAVGDEYTLVSDYNKDSVKIRHNMCGRVHEYIPYLFLTEQRCPDCARELDEVWHSWFECLQRYKERTGTANPPLSEIFEGRKLGQWCGNQRANLREGIIPDYNKGLMDSIGFDWAPMDSEWERRFEKYAKYKKIYGEADFYTEYEGVTIGKWASHQRKMRKRGTLSQERIEKLEAIGFDWTFGDEKKQKDWESKLALYSEYTEKFGTVVASTVYKEVRLGSWVFRQRKQYREGQLSAERIERLEAVGFEWTSHFSSGGIQENLKLSSQKSWEQKYELYVDYMQKYGEIARNVYYGDCALGEWVVKQKRAFKDGTLTEERQRLMLSVNPHLFDNSPAEHHKQPKQTKYRDQEWNEKFQLYVEYTKLYGCVSRDATYKGVQLGTWVRTQKIAYKEEKMPEERKMRLLEFDPHFFDRKRREP